MNNLSGGYIMVDLSSPNKVKQLEKAAALNKPLLVYYQDGTTEWGKVTVTYETVDDVDVPTYHITTANGFVTVEADGDTSARPLIVEGDGVSLVQEGVTITYCKWSLSGTHLMLVCAGTVENTTVLTGNTNIAKYVLPDNILNKIVPTFSSFIGRIQGTFWGSDYSNQGVVLNVIKATNSINIDTAISYTMTADRFFRLQFDLLIDNE